jgi:DivIVA domain-containing protein
MPLTPAEVHNVVFKKPPIGKRGYDEEEVDAFLDIIEVELARLIEESKDARDRLDKVSSTTSVNAPPPVSGGVSAADTAALNQSRDEAKRLAARVSDLEASLAQSKQMASKAQQDAAQAQQALSQAQNELRQAKADAEAARSTTPAEVPAAAAGASVAHLSQAERVLAFAQQAADEQTAAAQAALDKAIADAEAHQQSVRAEVKAFQDKTIAEAHAKAEQLDRDSRVRAVQTVQEAEQRAAQISAQLEQRKAALEKRLEELRTFEHEYRSRLKSYLESQLRDLDTSSRAEPTPAENSHGG